MYYTINNNNEVTLTLDCEALSACASLLSWGICHIHEDPDFRDRLMYYCSLRDAVCDACDELTVYDNPDIMEGDKS